MKIIIFEGTADEYIKALPTFAEQSHEVISTKGTKVAPPDSENSTVDDFRYILRRRSLSANVRKLLKLIYEAGPSGIFYSDLLDRMNMEGTALGGVLGGFGRRIAGTFPDKKLGLYSDFMKVEEDDDENWCYWLTESAIQALKAENLV